MQRHTTTKGIIIISWSNSFILHCIIMNFSTLFLLSLLLLISLNSHFTLAGKRKVHITDELDDVFDDEEDDDWKEWGKKPSPSFAPADLTKMDESKIKEEMMKRHTGPVIGFVKLRFGVRRTPVTTFCNLSWILIITIFAGFRWQKCYLFFLIWVKFVIFTCYAWCFWVKSVIFTCCEWWNWVPLKKMMGLS